VPETLDCSQWRRQHVARAQLRGQQLPAKKGKVRARLVQTAQIQDWDNLDARSAAGGTQLGNRRRRRRRLRFGRKHVRTSGRQHHIHHGSIREAEQLEAVEEDHQEAVDPQAVEEAAVEAVEVQLHQQDHRHPLQR
jgi:hypothetical protein